MHPVLWQFKIFGQTLSFYSYGTMLAISFAVGMMLVVRLAARDGYAREIVVNVLMVGIISALVGARLLYVITNPSTFADGFPVSIVDFKNKDGMVAYGGYLGGLIGAWVYSAKKFKWRFLRFSDSAAPLMALGLGFTRIGCLLAGCDYGKPTDLPIGIRFPKGSFAYTRHLREHLIDSDALSSAPVFPTQVAESLTGFILFSILLWFQLKKRKYAGQTLSLFLILYGAIRFMLEFVRGDAGRGSVWVFSTSQWVGLITIAFAIWLWRQKYPLTPEPVLASQRLQYDGAKKQPQSDSKSSKKSSKKK